MANKHSACSLGFLLLALIFAFPFVSGTTDASDVQALQVVYTSLNSPSQLTGWKSSGGDPCGESWKGITCEGSAVFFSIVVSGLGLSGTLGYALGSLLSLRNLDLSDNNIHDTIPYQLPPNLTSLNLAKNNLTGNLPYSFSTMSSLSYLGVMFRQQADRRFPGSSGFDDYVTAMSTHSDITSVSDGGSRRRS